MYNYSNNLYIIYMNNIELPKLIDDIEVNNILYAITIKPIT